MIKTVQRPTVPPVMEQKKLEQGEVYNAEVYDAPVPTVEDSGEPNMGTKYDTKKTRFDLVDPEWEGLLAEVMTFGAAKYGDRNWEKGILISRLYAAARRHIAAFIRGEDTDPESGKPHLGHANACLMMAWKMVEVHPELDDRASVTSKRSVQKLDEANEGDAKGNE